MQFQFSFVFLLMFKQTAIEVVVCKFGTSSLIDPKKMFIKITIHYLIRFIWVFIPSSLICLLILAFLVASYCTANKLQISTISFQTRTENFEMEDNFDSIQLSALGREICVGDFYNYFSDQILKGNRIWVFFPVSIT